MYCPNRPERQARWRRALRPPRCSSGWPTTPRRCSPRTSRTMTPSTTRSPCSENKLLSQKTTLTPNTLY
ncbi:hypothetical protein JYU34_016851 [Plutella xylostella]|uniref:Uncharacterized protein n=1 Tax=Plutella xylostella TaxID=51655 RepID=A0ABQ7Q3N4_PLUXY|nr:hypothetical protein JYU34_016851 [Plutella xylostella]